MLSGALSLQLLAGIYFSSGLTHTGRAFDYVGSTTIQLCTTHRRWHSLEMINENRWLVIISNYPQAVWPWWPIAGLMSPSEPPEIEPHLPSTPSFYFQKLLTSKRSVMAMIWFHKPLSLFCTAERVLNSHEWGLLIWMGIWTSSDQCCVDESDSLWCVHLNGFSLDRQLVHT